MTNRLVMVSLLLASSCTAIEAARCDKGDFACIQKAVDPADMKAALMYVGPCYRFAYDLCEKVDQCELGSQTREECREAFIDAICLVEFDPDAMNDCAYWSGYVECSYFDNPPAAHLDSVCWQSYLASQR